MVSWLRCLVGFGHFGIEIFEVFYEALVFGEAIANSR